MTKATTPPTTMTSAWFGVRPVEGSGGGDGGDKYIGKKGGYGGLVSGDGGDGGRGGGASIGTTPSAWKAAETRALNSAGHSTMPSKSSIGVPVVHPHEANKSQPFLSRCFAGVDVSIAAQHVPRVPVHAASPQVRPSAGVR